MFDSWRDAYECICTKGGRSITETFSPCTLLDREIELPHLVLPDVLTQSVLGEWPYIGSYIGLPVAHRTTLWPTYSISVN